MSNISVITKSTITMSSKDIAELVDSRHDNVRTSIERLANQGVITLPAMQEKPSEGGRPSKEYIFIGEQGKRDSIIVVAQLSPEFTARIVDRWMELERAANEHPSPQPESLHVAALENPDSLRKLLLTYTERTIEAERKLVEAEPKIAFYDAVTQSDNTFDMSVVAKIINRKGYGRNTIFAILRKHGILRSNNEPYQQYVNAGWFRLIEGKWTKPNGEEHTYYKTVVYQKGLEKIISLIDKEEQE